MVIKDTTVHTMVAGEYEAVSIHATHLELEGGFPVTVPISD